MKIVSKDLYRIKDLGDTHSSFFSIRNSKYKSISSKMNSSYIFNKINDYSDTGKITEIIFIKIDEIYNPTLNYNMFLLFNREYDIYVLIEKEELIKI